MPATSVRGRFRLLNPTSILFLISGLACTAVWGSCASGEDPDGDAADAVVVSVEDSSGVEIVTNRGDGWGPGDAWRLEPDLQVGELDGPLAFGRIAWVGPGPGGGMLVLDGQSHLVHVFDSVGTSVGSFGGEGEGPGEFRRPAAVTLLSDGRLAVAQGFPPVLHWLTSGGDYLSSTRLPIARDEAGTRTAGAFGIWQVTPAGQVFVQVQVIDPGADDGEMPVVLMEVDPAGKLSPDTIAGWTWNAGFGDEAIRVFEPVHTWMPGSDGMVVVSAGSPYEIQWHYPAVGLQRVVRRVVEGARVTDRHRQRAIEDMREGMSAGGASEGMVDDMLDRVEFESTVPEVLRVWVSEPDGGLWIGVHDPDLFAIEPDGSISGWTNALDVFESGGRYLGRIPLPVGFTLRVVTEDALYGMWEDELEVPFARRYRLVRPAREEKVRD
jgi:hypothetical protein